jgi:hypothetical protein
MARVESPGLGVVLSVKPLEDVMWMDTVAVRVDVTDATAPLRVSVYLDGDLIDTWVPRGGGYELHVPDVRGRHLVTARVTDAAGRWGGASELVELTA